MLTSTTTLQETNRAYVCPQRIGCRDCFKWEASCWTRCHFQKHKPHVCSTPTVCGAGLLGAGGGNAPKGNSGRGHPRTLESPQSPPGSASLLQRSPQGPLLLLCTEGRSGWPLPAALPPPQQGLYLCGLHTGNSSPE